MKKVVFAFGAVALAGSAVAQEPAVSEDEARCWVTAVCKVEKEKKFSLANISTKSAGSKTAPAPVLRGTAVSSGFPKVARTRYVSERGRAVPTPGAARAMDLRLTFDLGSAVLTPVARSRMDVFAKVLTEDSASARRFKIEGHTDSIGSADSNLDLSRRRAQSVVAYLVDRGVPATQLKADGFGFARPRPGTSAANPDNRRVEIVRD